MNPTFNLIEKPWIPCVDAKGTVVLLNLQDALTQSPALQDLAGDSPLVTASLYRLLLAILHRIFGPEDTDAWYSLWEKGTFDAQQIGDYLERWQHRFDLFDADRPFYQTPGNWGKPKVVNSLTLDLASGNNATLFNHNTDEGNVALTPAEAARALVTAQAFGLAGLSGGLSENFTDGTCARGILFLVQGDTLFETLLLNLLRYPTEDDVLPHHTGDCPVWEMDEASSGRTRPLGYLDYLTWQNRRILLLPEVTDEGIVVRQMTIAQGLSIEAEMLDPMKHYRRDKKRGYLVQRFNEERALWRDSAALFKLKSGDFRPPVTFHWLAELIEDSDGRLKKWHRRRYLALGMANNQAKVDFYRAEHNPLPLEYLKQPSLVTQLDTALEMTESVRNQLWGAGRTLAKFVLSPQADAEGAHEPAPEDLGRLTEQWGIDRDYWAQLEIPFRQLIEDLPNNPEETLNNWQQTLERTAWRALERVANNLEYDPRNMKATVQARGQLAAGLAKVLQKK